jgi:hypothetical protein
LDWKLFGLGREDVWQHLEALAGDRCLIVQRAGNVAHITWRYPDPEEVMRALIGSR